MLQQAEEEAPSCRICLEPAGPSAVAPCECSGTSRLVHVECLERWVVERGSAVCEVCKAPYAGSALTDLGRNRIAEREMLRLEWPQHDRELFEAEELALLARPTFVRPTARRLFILTLLSLSAVLFLAQEEGAVLSSLATDHVRLTDSEAERYILDLGLGVSGGEQGRASAVFATHAAAAYAPRAPAPAPAVLDDRPFHTAEEEEQQHAYWEHQRQQGRAQQRSGALFPEDQQVRWSAVSDTGPAAAADAGAATRASAAAVASDYITSLASSWVSAASRPLAYDASPPPPLRTTRYEYADTFPDDHDPNGREGDRVGPERGGGLMNGGPLPPSVPAAVILPSPHTVDTEALLKQLMLEDGCAQHPPPYGPEGERSGDSTAHGTGDMLGAGEHRERSRCDKAELVLAHLRRRHADEREAHAEQQASEAMERLTRAFVLLCMLRIVIAQQQRRRFLMERATAQAATWDQMRQPRGPLRV